MLIAVLIHSLQRLTELDIRIDASYSPLNMELSTDTDRKLALYLFLHMSPQRNSNLQNFRQIKACSLNTGHFPVYRCRTNNPEEVVTYTVAEVTIFSSHFLHRFSQ